MAGPQGDPPTEPREGSNTSTQPRSCANCGKTDVASSCKACHNAPSRSSAEGTLVSYCNRECQTAHWEKHKADCKDRKERRALYRAAELARRIWYIYRENAFDVCITAVHYDEERRVLKLTRDDGETKTLLHPHGLLHKFPNHLFASEWGKEAALSATQSDDAITHIRGALHFLFAGSKLALHEIRVELRNVEFSTVFAPLEEGVDSPLTSQHTIIRLTRSSGEQLALDIAGAQFGFKDALMPWDCFERRVARALPHMANGTVNEAVEAQVWNPMLPVTDNVRRTCAFYGRLTNDFDVGMSAWNQVSCFQRSGLKLPQEEHEQFGQRLCDAVRMQVEFSVDKVNPSWQEVLTRVDQESMKFQRDLPLFRAADLLRKMSYVQREVGYDQPITKVQEENGFLNIHLGDFDKLPTTVPGGALYPGLQKILCTLPEQDRDTVLSLGMCHDAICNLHLMITWLLKDLCTRAELVTLKVRNIKRMVQTIDAHGITSPNQGSIPHTVLKISSRSGKIYCLDITCAQYGWTYALREWSRFEQTCSDPWTVLDIIPLSKCVEKRKAAIYREEYGMFDKAALCIKATLKLHVDVTELFDRAMRPTTEKAAIDILKSSGGEYVAREQELLDKVRHESGKAFQKLDPTFLASMADLERVLKERLK